MSTSPRILVRFLPVVLLIAALAMVGLIVVKTIATADHAAGRFFLPRDRVGAVITAAVESLHRKADLVVCQLQVTAWVNLRQSTYWLGICWGTTTADVMAPGNRVQFVERLSQLTDHDFSYDAASNTLTCRFPAPVLDTGMVQIQPNPAKIMVHGSNGWALFNLGSVERKAKARLRAAVILQAQRSFLKPLVRARARQVLQHLLELIIHPLRPDLRIRVQFQSPAKKHEKGRF